MIGIIRKSNNVTKTFNEQMLHWLCGFSALADGVVGILSVGFFRTTLSLDAARHLARRRMEILP